MSNYIYNLSYFLLFLKIAAIPTQYINLTKTMELNNFTLENI